MQTRQPSRVLCVVSLISLLLYVTAIIMSLAQGNIREALPLAVIFMFMEDVPLSEMLLPAAHLGLFIGVAILFFTNLPAFKQGDSKKK